MYKTVNTGRRKKTVAIDIPVLILSLE